MKTFRAIILAALLLGVGVQAFPVGLDSVGPRFAGSRALLSSNGRTFGLVVPLGRQNTIGPPRGLLRNGTLQIHGAVREGYFYAKAALGTPPRTFSLIIDTGSTITYVPCSDCTHCGDHTDAAFDPGASSTAQVLSCGHPRCICGSPPCSCNANKCFYQRMYAEHSSSEGWLVLDKFAFPDGGPPLDITFGCETRESGEIYRQAADGILGLGNNVNALHSQLASTGAVDRMFSLCFGFPAGGTLLLGDVPLPRGVRLAYTPLVESSTPYYVVKMEAVAVGGKPLNVAPAIFERGYGTVMDSGTTFSYLPTPVFEALTAALDRALAGKGLTKGRGPDPSYPDICWRGAPDAFNGLTDIFPTVRLTFAGGATLVLPPHRYLFLIARGEYCLGVFDNGQAGTLIGGIAVRNTLVQYDLGRQRVGFGDADCPNLAAAVAKAAAATAPPPPARPPAAAPARPQVPSPAPASAAPTPAKPAAAGAATQQQQQQQQEEEEEEEETTEASAGEGDSSSSQATGMGGEAAPKPAAGGDGGAGAPKGGGDGPTQGADKAGGAKQASSSSSSSSREGGTGGSSKAADKSSGSSTPKATEGQTTPGTPGAAVRDGAGGGGGSPAGSTWMGVAIAAAGLAAVALAAYAAFAAGMSPGAALAALTGATRFRRLPTSAAAAADLEQELAPLSGAHARPPGDAGSSAGPLPLSSSVPRLSNGTR